MSEAKEILECGDVSLCVDENSAVVIKCGQKPECRIDPKTFESLLMMAYLLHADGKLASINRARETLRS